MDSLYEGQPLSMLPTEVWKLIGNEPEVYWVLVRTHSAFNRGVTNAQQDFIRWIEQPLGMISKLPNGCTHSVAGLPADTTRGLNWYYNGQRHRDGDLPAVEKYNTSIWYKYGEKHRVNQGEFDQSNHPAVIKPNVRKWFVGGKLHRIDGPAIIEANDRVLWYHHGRKVTPQVGAATAKRMQKQAERQFLI